MNNKSLDDFESVYNKIARIVAGFIFERKNTGGFLMVDNEQDFIEKLKKTTGLHVQHDIETTDNNFPQLYTSSFHLYNTDSRIVSATSADYFQSRENAIIRSKGECLERLSCYFDLDIAIKNKWDFDKIKTKTNLVFVKSTLSFSFKYINPLYVYYDLKKAKVNSIYNNDISNKYHPSTNGAAGHFDYKKAVLGGWLEIIQRDAFLMYWLNSIPPKLIDVDQFLENESLEKDNFKKLISDFKKYNISYYFLDITSDINVPSVCCVLVIDSVTGKRVALGASSGFDGISNLFAAAVEANITISTIYFKEPFILEKDYVPFSDGKINLQERRMLYTTDSMYECFKFFVSSSEKINIRVWSQAEKALQNNPTRQIEYLKKIFKEKVKENKQYDVLVFKFKNKVIKIFDYKVVKVICKALYPLYLNESLVDTEHPRFQEFLKNKGLETKAKLNIWPHPFA